MAEIGGINVTATRVSSAKVSIAMAQVSAVATRVESRFTGAGMLAVGLGILGGALAAMLQAQIAWPGLAFIGGLSGLFFVIGAASIAMKPHAATVIDTTSGSVTLLRSREHAQCIALRDAIAAAMDARG